MIFVVVAAEENKFVVGLRENFFHREAFDFVGQIFKLERGDFIFKFFLQKNSSKQLFRAEFSSKSPKSSAASPKKNFFSIIKVAAANINA